MKYKDIRGQRFGQITVIRKSKKRSAKGQIYWICKCDCGKYLIVRGDNLRCGNTTKCTQCRGKGKPSKFYEEGDANVD